MNALIVYAHHEPSSFSASLLSAAAGALRECGARVEVSDLYAIGFDPVSDRRNFQTVYDGARLRQQAEELHASRTGDFAPDIQTQIDRLLRSDLLIFQFPLWWLGMPAILKGWVDRVFACGVVYGGGRWFDRGVMKGRRAMCIVTVGGARSDYDPSGKYATTVDAVLLPIHRGILEFTGFEVLPPFIVHGPGQLDDAERRDSIDALRARMLALWSREHPGHSPFDRTPHAA